MENLPNELSELMVDLAKWSHDVGRIQYPERVEWDRFQRRLKELLEKVKSAGKKFEAKRLSIGGTLGWPPRININFDFEL